MPRLAIPRLPGYGDKNLKEKVNFAIRQVEIQRKDVEQLLYRLDERRKSIFSATVRAIEQKDEMRARVFSNEHVELQKLTKVVGASELSLLQVEVRLETLRDVGDVMFALTNAFKEVKRIGKSIEGLVPNLESAATEINDSFSNILSELGILSPTISIALSDTPTEIFEKAEQLISERTSELADLPKSIQQIEKSEGTSILDQTKRIALLATGEDGESEEEFKPTILVGGNVQDPELIVRKYIREKGTDKIDIFDCSAQTNLPVDLVEQAYIKLLTEKNTGSSSKSDS